MCERLHDPSSVSTFLPGVRWKEVRLSEWQIVYLTQTRFRLEHNDMNDSKLY